MSNITPVARALDAVGVPYRLFRHPGPVSSLEQAARERGQTPDQVVRSIVFRVASGEYVMVLVSGSRQVSWPVLRRYLGQSRVTTASEEEVRAVTGYERGAVSPFGLPRPMRILLDEDVLSQTEISIGSGVRGTTAILKTDDMMRALGKVEVGQFTAHSE
ncbi:MAG TPA: YbaK/EbsC family protein [Anaerolineae bacterium]|nr:YbaK/EbsC family protein [Anaerolineae bacterium]